MKIYVVTSGEYSDYGINALFSTKELAQLYMDKFNEPFSGYNDIMECEVDEMEADLRSDRKPFNIIMERDGQIVRVDLGSTYGKYDAVVKTYYLKKEQFEISLFADNEEQAIKIANEKRLKYLLDISKKLE